MITNRNLVILISSILVTVLLAAVIWPLAEKRNESIDRAIVQDFGEISQQVDDYFSDNGRLPGGLSDLEISDAISARASKYSYSLDKESSRSYELCAEFKTDTTSSNRSFDTFIGSTKDNRQGHNAGFDCLDYEVYDYFYDEFEQAPFDSFFDLEESSGEGDTLQHFESPAIQQL